MDGEIRSTPPVPFERVLGLLHLIALDFYSHRKIWDVRILFHDNMATLRSYKNVFGAIALMRRLPVDGEYTNLKCFMLTSNEEKDEELITVLLPKDGGLPVVKVDKTIAHLVVKEIYTWKKNCFI